mgnify:CR=1 FL=1
MTSPWSGLVYSINDSGYHIGRFYRLVLYANAYSYLLFSICLILAAVGRKVLGNMEKLALLGGCLILIVGDVARMVYPMYLIMDSFYMLSILVMYLAFQNPDLYTERKTGLLNQSAVLSLLQNSESTAIFPCSRWSWMISRRTAGCMASARWMRACASLRSTCGRPSGLLCCLSGGRPLYPDCPAGAAV